MFSDDAFNKLFGKSVMSEHKSVDAVCRLSFREILEERAYISERRGRIYNILL